MRCLLLACLIPGLLASLPALAQLPPPLTCLIRPDRSSDIGTDAAGIVADIRVRRADRVRKGDVLVQLDDRLAQADLTKAVIARDNTRARLDRAEKVTAGRAISAEEVATLRAEAAMAEADHQRALLQVQRARILAPFDGTVADVMTEAGQLISVEPLLRLIDTRRLRVELVFPAEAFGQLAEGDDLPVTVDLTGKQTLAKVATIDRYIDATSNSLSVIAELDNPDGDVPAGTTCRLGG